MSPDQLLRFMFGALTGIVIFAPLTLILFKDFQIRPRTNNPNKISSFFELNEFVQAENLRGYAKLYSILVCGVLWIAYVSLFLSDKICLSALTIVDASLKSSSLSGFADTIVASGVGAPIALFILMVVAIIVFFPYFSKAHNLLKSSAQAGVDFDDTCDKLVGIAANDIKDAGLTAEYITKEIETLDLNTGSTIKFREATAIPREFGDNPDEDSVLRYALLKSAIKDASSTGLIPALRAIQKTRNVKSKIDNPPPPINIRQMIVVSLFFAGLSLIYCALIGRVGNYFCGDKNCTAPLLGEFVFPGATKDAGAVFGSVVIEYFIFSAQVALPFWIGIALYERKQKSSSNKFTFADNFVPVAFMQITWSFFLSLLSVVAIYVFSWVNSSAISPFTPWSLLQFAISVLLAPVITVLWVWLSVRPVPSLLQGVAAALVAALIYGFMGFCYTCLYQAIRSPNFTQQDVYWAVLAFYVVLVCGILWLMTTRKLSTGSVEVG